MITIRAATRGLISNNLPLGIATDGLIYIAAVQPVQPGGVSGGGAGIERHGRFVRDDREILDFIGVVVGSGILDR